MTVFHGFFTLFSMSANRTRPEIEFTLRLGRALHRHGAPSHRLEQVLTTLSNSFKIDGQFFTTPTAMFASFELPNERMAHLQRVHSSSIDLNKLCLLDDLFNRAADHLISPSDGLLELDQINQVGAPYGKVFTVLCFALSSAAAARFFDGGLLEIQLALMCGLALGLLSLIADKAEPIQRTFAVLAPAIVAAVAGFGASFIGASADIATLAGLIVLVPGFTVTIAATELAMGHLVSGTARMAGGIMALLMMTAGVFAGRAACQSLGISIADIQPTQLPNYSLYLALLVAGPTLGVLFKAPKRELLWVTLSVLVPFAIMQACNDIATDEWSLFLGALSAGGFSNFYARIFNRPAVITRLPGMLVLVPGALSFVSISALMAGDVLQGLESAFKVMMTATVLVTGFMVSNLLVHPRKAL